MTALDILTLAVLAAATINDLENKTIPNSIFLVGGLLQLTYTTIFLHWTAILPGIIFSGLFYLISQIYPLGKADVMAAFLVGIQSFQHSITFSLSLLISTLYIYMVTAGEITGKEKLPLIPGFLIYTIIIFLL